MDRFKLITEYIKDIIRGTLYEGHIYVVGGSVRDMQMKNAIKDIDLVIDIENGGVEFAKFCMDSNLLTHDVVIYERFGTAMFKFLKFPDDEIECVMTRGEKYPDRNSRNPETVFASIEDDCIRRDLTINALYYNISTGEIVDMVGFDCYHSGSRERYMASMKNALDISAAFAAEHGKILAVTETGHETLKDPKWWVVVSQVAEL